MIKIQPKAVKTKTNDVIERDAIMLFPPDPFGGSRKAIIIRNIGVINIPIVIIRSYCNDTK
jgi:hypothetical protein